jgi:hypothetical protein
VSVMLPQFQGLYVAETYRDLDCKGLQYGFDSPFSYAKALTSWFRLVYCNLGKIQLTALRTCARCICNMVHNLHGVFSGGRVKLCARAKLTRISTGEERINSHLKYGNDQRRQPTPFLTLSVRQFAAKSAFASLPSLVLISPVAGMALADPPAPDLPLSSGQIVGNPQTAYTFAGWDQLGNILGVPDKWGLSLGGYLIPEFNWIASGGVDPGSTFGNFALGLHASLDAQKALNIPGGTFGIEFLEFTGGATNDAAGSVQQYTVMDGPAPRNRQELSQLWWRQRLFNDKLIFHIGKMNGPGAFGNLQMPVIMGGQRQDHDITNLIFVPVGLNPTLFGRLPSYYNTGYGAVVSFAPTKQMYASYGLFDANGVRGVQTGIKCEPTLNSYKLHIGELGYSWLLGKEDMPGRIGLGVWGQTGERLHPLQPKKMVQPAIIYLPCSVSCTCIRSATTPESSAIFNSLIPVPIPKWSRLTLAPASRVSE